MKGFQIFVCILLAALTGSIFYQATTQNAAINELIKQQTAAQKNEAETLKALSSCVAEMNRNAILLAEYSNKHSESLELFFKKITEEPILSSGDVLDPTEAAIVLSKVPNDNIVNYSARILGYLGGEKAENRLVKLAETTTNRNSLSGIFEGLRQMGSQKAYPLLLARAKSGNLEELERISHFFRNIPTNAIPELLEIIKNIKGSDNRSSNVRGNLYNALSNTHDPRVCEAIYKMLPNEQSYSRSRALSTISQCVGHGQAVLLGKALKQVPYERNRGSHTWSSAIRKLGEIRDIRTTEYIIPFLECDNDSIKRQTIETLIKMEDPLAAKALCEILPNAGSTRSNLTTALKRYPGVVYDKEKNTFTPAGEEEIKKLLAERDKKIAQLFKADKAKEKPEPEVF